MNALLLINLALCAFILTLVFRPRLIGFSVPPIMQTNRRFGVIAILATVSLALFGLVTAAAAQEAGQDAGNGADWTELAMPLIGAVLTAILGYIASWVSAKYGVDVEVGDRDALHSALMTGARLALARQLTGHEAVTLILQYASKSVPDALARLSPKKDLLRDLAESKIQEASSASQAAVESQTELMYRR